MADLQITGLNALTQSSIAVDDELAIADVSQTETKKVTVKDLVNAVVTATGTNFLSDSAIPGTKIGTLGTDKVTTATIQDNKVTNVKIETSVDANTGIDGGTKLRAGSVTIDRLDASKFDRGLSVVSAKLGITNSITAGTKSGITYTAQGLISSVSDLAASDLPEATSSAIGAVKVESSSLLEVSGTGAIDVKNVSGLSAGTYVSVTVNAKGQVTAGSTTATATNIPTATTSAKGGVIVPASGGMSVDGTGNLSIATQGSVSAGSYAKVTVNTKGIVTGTGSLVDTDIPNHSAQKLTSGTIPADRIGSSAINSDRLDTGAVTNDKVETSTSATTGLDGATKIRDATITPAKLNTSNLDRSLNVASGNLGINNTITAATRSGITYNAQGLITASAALVAGDLPVATTSAVGGVSVGTGLSVSGSGALSLTNSVTGATVSGITFNNQGMITAATGLAAGDLPVSTTSAKGAVQITSGGGLTVDGSGNLTTSTSGVSAGTYQSVTVNTKGVVTAGAALTDSLIPVLDASKITTGSFAAARIGANTIDGSKLSDASTAVFQSISQAGYPTAQFSGQILFDTVSEDAYIWDGNAWQAITTLTKGSLVFGGNFNANTSKMTACTSAGLAAGLAVGSNLPTPSATTDGLYVVVDTAGTPSAPAPVVAFSPPDYILGVTNASGSSWNEIDLSQTVAGQVASNITFTPYGQLSSTNVQDAMQELETEKLAKAGGEVTGQILISNTGSLVFEGSTVDAFETTLTVADPTTSDKTITLPNVTGTVITSGDTGTVTGTMLANDTIQNVDIKSDAAIAFSKLAALTSAQILVGNGSNVATAVAVTGDISINNAGLTAIASGVIVDGDISGSAAITGSKIATGTTSAVGVLQLTDSTSSTSATTAATPNAVKSAYDLANAALPKTGGTLTGHVLVDNDKEVRFYEADGNGTAYVGIKGATDKGSESSYTISLPAAAPTANKILKANASTPTTLEWVDDATNVAAGSLSGTTMASNVVTSSLTTLGTLTGLTVDGDVQFSGASNNVVWDKSDNALEFQDAAKLKLGSDDDIVIHHTGGYNYIEGALRIGKNNSVRITDANDDTRLQVTNTGATVTGTLVADGLTVDTNTLHVDATNNRVGIGTTSPDSMLHVSGSSGSAQLRLTRSDTASDGNDYGRLYWESSTDVLTGQISVARASAENDGNMLFYTANSGTLAERMRIDSNGVCMVGLSSALSSNNARLQVAHTDGNADIIVHRAGNNANPPALNFQKTRNASIGNYGTVVQDNDELGSIRWGGADGSDIAFAARIVASVDGTPGSNDMPGRLTFHTSGDGNENLSERMRIDKAGTVLIGKTTTNFTDPGVRLDATGSIVSVKTSTSTTSGVSAGGTLVLANPSNTDNNFSNIGGYNSNELVTSQIEFVNVNQSSRHGAIRFLTHTGSNLLTALTLDKDQNATFAGSVSDSKGNLRSIPFNSTSGAYNLAASDAGKVVGSATSWTIPASTFSSGDAVTLLNLSGSAIGLTASALSNLWNTADGVDIKASTLTLGARTMATIYFQSASEAFIQAAALTVS